MSEDLPITDQLVIAAASMEWEFSRSGGPGGQHVNTTDTRARLRVHLDEVPLTPGARRRLREAHPAWVTDDGDLVLTSDEHRSRHQNVEALRQRLREAVRAALVPPRPRVATRPTRSSQKKRVEGKKKRGETKAGRKRPAGDD